MYFDKCTVEGEEGASSQSAARRRSSSQIVDPENDVDLTLQKPSTLIIFKCQTSHTRQTHTTCPSYSHSSSSASSPRSSVQSSGPHSPFSLSLYRYYLGPTRKPPPLQHTRRKPQQQCPGRKNNSHCPQSQEAVTSSPTQCMKKCQRSKSTKWAFCNCLCSIPVAR